LQSSFAPTAEPGRPTRFHSARSCCTPRKRRKSGLRMRAAWVPPCRRSDRSSPLRGKGDSRARTFFAPALNWPGRGDDAQRERFCFRLVERLSFGGSERAYSRPRCIHDLTASSSSSIDEDSSTYSRIGRPFIGSNTAASFLS